MILEPPDIPKETRREARLDSIIALQMGQHYAKQLDTRVRMVLRPKPWWVPKWAHEWLLGRLFYLESFTTVTTHGGQDGGG